MDWRRVVDIECLRAAGRQVAVEVSAAANWIGDHVFRLSAWIALLLLGWALARQLLQSPETKLVLALTTLFLVSALVAKHGSDIIPRLKKIGPLELFKEELPGLLASLQQELGKVPPAANSNEVFVARDIADSELYLYERLDLYVSLVEFWRWDIKKEKALSRYPEALLFVSKVAFSQKRWARARARLEGYRELIGDAGDPVALRYNFALIDYSSAFDLPPELRTEPFENARKNFRLVVASDKDHYRAYFYLGYVQDELKNYGSAIECNLEALKIRPQFAPARYNAACSYLKRGELAKGMEMLEGLQPADHGIQEIRKTLPNDEEINPLRMDTGFKTRIDALVARLDGGGAAEAGSDEPPP